VTSLGISNKYVVEQSRCIRCGRCVEVCPMHLMPVLIYKAAQTGSVEEMNSVHLMDCIECGCCAYTCPASVPLVLGFRASKHLVREAAKTKK
jgi:electron transport complex protein RnfC